MNRTKSTVLIILASMHLLGASGVSIVLLFKFHPLFLIAPVFLVTMGVFLFQLVPVYRRQEELEYIARKLIEVAKGEK